MTWSTRNRLPSTIVEVFEGEVAANVSLRVVTTTWWPS